MIYKEGTYFALPLRDGGFAIGLVARATPEGKVILCYFFGLRRSSVPAISELMSLTADQALHVFRVGDLNLLNGKWPIIGQLASWKRSEWPMPPFKRSDELSRKAWKVIYFDVNPNQILREEPEPYESLVQRDAVLGAGAVEMVLTKSLMSAVKDKN